VLVHNEGVPVSGAMRAHAEGHAEQDPRGANCAAASYGFLARGTCATPGRGASAGEKRSQGIAATTAATATEARVAGGDGSDHSSPNGAGGRASPPPPLRADAMGREGARRKAQDEF
jgi:hypothetical protein